MKTYHCIIEYDDKKVEWTHYCSGPVVAINEFDRMAQKTKETSLDRKKVLRRKLRPDEYRITRLWCEGIEYDDIPKMRSNDLNAPKPPKEVTPEFGGMPAAGYGRIAP